jgi:hypothetical protein
MPLPQSVFPVVAVSNRYQKVNLSTACRKQEKKEVLARQKCGESNAQTGEIAKERRKSGVRQW